MNLVPLFEIQSQLDEHIEKEHPREPGEDRLAKKILALFVELGELANEHRGFKYWSNDQEPRIGGECSCDDGYIDIYMGHGVVEQDVCPRCEGIGELPNTLLEEYVDCLHFILSIGLETGKYKEVEFQALYADEQDIVMQLNVLFDKVGDFYVYQTKENYQIVLSLFLALGELLGFTWEQIEQAYIHKNEVNHQRQEQGY